VALIQGSNGGSALKFTLASASVYFWPIRLLVTRFVAEGEKVMGLLEQTILSKMAALSLSRQVLARISNIRESSLCRGLLGVDRLGGPDILLINQILDDLQLLRKRAFPFALPISDVAALQVLLHQLRDGNLDSVLDPDVAANLARQISGAR
jgi:hypothetical protein